MVWIKDIWIYFLNESYIEFAHLDVENGQIFFEECEYSIKIPRVFTRVSLLRSYISKLGDIRLIKEIASVNDLDLLKFFHEYYLPYYSSENEYSKWVEYGKEEIFEYAKKWCCNNNIKCTTKEQNNLEKLTYLQVY